MFKSLRTLIKKFVKQLSILLVIGGIFAAIIIVFLHSLELIDYPDANAILRSQDEHTLQMLESKELNSNPARKFVAQAYRKSMCPLVGIACSADITESKKYFDTSIIGIMSNAMVLPYKYMPASGIQETYSTLANAGIVPEAIAAEGVGFGAIKPFREIWKVFRNICFTLLALVMVVMGILFLFRVKLGAQSAMTMESALPRIVISLLLITFSYSIAGFLIDFMYLLMALVIAILGQGVDMSAEGISVLQNEFLTAGMGDLFYNLLPRFSELNRLSYSILDIFPIMVRQIIHIISGVGIAAGVMYILAFVREVGFSEIFNGISALTFGWGNLPGVLIKLGIILIVLPIVSYFALPVIMASIIFITVLFLFLRIFFMLVSTYLRILLLILLAPFYMLLEAIPGQNMFSYWFRNLFGELLTFPAVAAILLTGHFIVFMMAPQQSLNIADKYILIPGVWNTATPPEMWRPPFLSGIDQDAIIVIIGLGFIFIIPDLVQQLKNALGVKPPPINVGLGTFFAGGGALMAGGGSLVKGGVGLMRTFGGKEKGLNDLPFIGRLGKAAMKPFQNTSPPPGPNKSAAQAAAQQASAKGRKWFFGPKQQSNPAQAGAQPASPSATPLTPPPTPTTVPPPIGGAGPTAGAGGSKKSTP